MARKRSRRARQRPGVAQPGPSARRDLPLALIATLGVVLTTVLLWGATRAAGLPYCGAGSGCDVVQGSAWSSFLGVPLALWGLLMYLAMLLVAIGVGQAARRVAAALFLGACGLGVSVYLAAVSLFAIGATCAYCLASLVLMAAACARAILARNALGPRWPRATGAGVAAATVLALLMQLQASGAFSDAGEADPALVALAQHLATRDAAFYGASWCPHCQQQKALFGAAAQYLPYVECSPDGPRAPRAAACELAGIKNYPTWIIDGRRIERVLDAGQLARLSGFEPDVPID